MNPERIPIKSIKIISEGFSEGKLTEVPNGNPGEVNEKIVDEILGGILK